MPPLDPDKIPTISREPSDDDDAIEYRGPSPWILLGLLAVAVAVIVVIALVSGDS